jgi:rubrerythrin
VFDDVNLFLAHAIKLERDAARRFEDLMHSMQTIENRELEGLFRTLAAFSRLHVDEALARGGFRIVPTLAPQEFQWPDGVTPEAAGWQGVDGALDELGALELALAGERSGHAYYCGVAAQATDPEVGILAARFAEEEAAHVTELERWLERAAAKAMGADAAGRRGVSTSAR